MRLTIVLSLIIAGLCLFIAFDQCSRKPCPDPQVTTVTTIIPGDSIPKPYPVVVPGKPIIERDTFWKDVDSAAIIADYLSRKIYKGIVLRDDSLLFASFDAYVSRNNLDSVHPFFAIRKETSVTHTTITYDCPESNKLRPFGLAAGGFGYASPWGSDAGPSAEVSFKRWSFEYGYGVNGSHLGSIKYKIW